MSDRIKGGEGGEPHSLSINSLLLDIIINLERELQRMRNVFGQLAQGEIEDALQTNIKARLRTQKRVVGLGAPGVESRSTRPDDAESHSAGRTERRLVVLQPDSGEHDPEPRR